MLNIIMNFEEFYWNFVLYMFILGVILFIIARALRKKDDKSKNVQKNEKANHTVIYTNRSSGSSPIVHIKQEIIYECPICGYTSNNEDDFDDGACIMCDAI